MKKRVLTALLALVLMATSIPAFAITFDPSSLGLLPSGDPAEFELKEDNFFVHEGFLGVTPQYTAVLVNKSGKKAMLSTGELELLDKNGASITTVKMYGSFPSYVAPDGLAVLEGNYLNLTPEQVEQVASWKLTVSGFVVAADEPGNSIELKAEASYEQVTALGMSLTEEPIGRLVTTITNETQDTLFDVRSVVLLRDSEGKLLMSLSSMAVDVGIPAGGTILSKSTVQTSVLASFEKSNRAIASYEALAFVDINE